MSTIKRTPADAAFSDCVRERANWKCEVCGTDYTNNTRGLHCSHYHGRANWSVRFNPDNAAAHCYGCHSKLEGSPHDFYQLWIKFLGEGAYQLLLEKKNDTGLGKEYRRTKGKGDIAKHYRNEFKRMKDMRALGDTSRIEFCLWL